MSPCFQCGKTESREIAFEVDEATVAVESFCSECLDEHCRGADLWRAEFERLLASGATNASANRELCARIALGENPPETT